MVLCGLHAATPPWGYRCVASTRDVRVLPGGWTAIAQLVLSAGEDGFDGPADNIQGAALYRNASVAGGYRAGNGGGGGGVSLPKSWSSAPPTRK